MQMIYSKHYADSSPLQLIWTESHIRAITPSCFLHPIHKHSPVSAPAPHPSGRTPRPPGSFKICTSQWRLIKGYVHTFQVHINTALTQQRLWILSPISDFWFPWGMDHFPNNKRTRGQFHQSHMSMSVLLEKMKAYALAPRSKIKEKQLKGWVC